MGLVHQACPAAAQAWLTVSRWYLQGYFAAALQHVVVSKLNLREYRVGIHKSGGIYTIAPAEGLVYPKVVIGCCWLKASRGGDRWHLSSLSVGWIKRLMGICDTTGCANTLLCAAARPFARLGNTFWLRYTRDVIACHVDTGVVTLQKVAEQSCVLCGPALAFGQAPACRCVC